ncbi:MAG: rhodanese family protein [Lautropia sp.]|nr:rhodanese family protein [Lautropia sp.]
MPLTSVSPHAAQAMVEKGAVLIDIRPVDENARERIAVARHIPMEQLMQDSALLDPDRTVIFHCRSGNRTRLNAARLRACTTAEAYLLDGGLDGWKRVGLPVIRDVSQPLELQRQVQIAAGSVILLGTVLGMSVSSWFHLMAGFVGAGLVFAGVSGFCGLARLLMLAPWNRRAQGR